MAIDQYATQLEEIGRRLAASTPGPWSRHGCDVHAEGSGVLFKGRDGSADVRSQADSDAEFVAHARADVALLLDLVAGDGRRAPSAARVEL